MDIEDKKNEAVFEKAAFEKTVGEGLINGVYIDIDARLTAEKHKLSWQMVEYWAGREYESQQIKGCNSWN